MNVFQELVSSLQSATPDLLSALIIFVGALLIAWLAAALTRMLLKRTKLHRHLRDSGALTHRSDADSIAKWIGTIIFITIALFGLVPVFQTLNLPYITQPLSEFLNEILTFLPNIISAFLLGIVAWLTATLAHFVVLKALQMAGLDERMRKHAHKSHSQQASTHQETAEHTGSQGNSIAKSLANATFFFVLLLFLPAILGALQLEGILQPVQEMTGVILNALPNILAALLILILGLFAARIVQQLAQNLLEASQADKLASYVGLERAIGTKSVSSFLSYLVYVLVALPVIVAALNALQLEAVTQPVSAMLNEILAAVPNIAAALLLLALALVVGKAVANMIRRMLEGMGFDSWFGTMASRAHAGKAIKSSPSTIVSRITLAAIMLIATMEAANLLGFALLQTLLGALLVFLGQVVLGIAILAAGFWIAHIVQQIIHDSSVANATFLAKLSHVLIVIFAAALAIQQLGISDGLVNLVVSFTIGSIALAAAIAFGVGGREPARKMLEQWTSSARTPSTQS